AAAGAAHEPHGDRADGGVARAGEAPAADAGPAAGSAPIVEFLPDADGVRPPGLPPRTPPDARQPTGTPPTGPEAAVPGPASPYAQGAPAPVGDDRSSSRQDDRSSSRRDDRLSRRRGASRSGAGARSSGSAAGAGTRASRRAAERKEARRSPGRRNVTVAVLTLSVLIMIPLVLWVSDADSGGRHDTADGGRSADAPSRSTDPSWARTGETKDGTVRGRLRNAATGRCVGFAGTTPASGAEARLIPCSSESATQWSYGTDGLLRDAAHPGLCLDSHLSYSVQLAPCTDLSRPGAKNVRYDLTLQGLLVPRWNPDLALVPASAEGESALVLKLRENEPVQYWTFDTSSPSLQLEVVNWDSTDGDAKGSVTGKPSASAIATDGTRTPTATATTPGSHATPSAEPSDTSCASVSAFCPGDGLNGSPRDGGYGTGSGSGGYGSLGGGGHGSRR
ncbi:ricin-type beta-trefoil lectin domain protein, partial [Streptomyces sp. NPDC005070]